MLIKKLSLIIFIKNNNDLSNIKKNNIYNDNMIILQLRCYRNHRRDNNKFCFLQLILLFCGPTFVRCADNFAAHASKIIKLSEWHIFTSEKNTLILLNYQPFGHVLS